MFRSISSELMMLSDFFRNTKMFHFASVNSNALKKTIKNGEVNELTTKETIMPENGH